MSENLPFRGPKMADSENRKLEGDEEEDEEIDETVSLFFICPRWCFC